MPISACDMYSRGRNSASAAPTSTDSASGTMNHHFRRLQHRQVVERVKTTFFHYWILMG